MKHRTMAAISAAFLVSACASVPGFHDRTTDVVRAMTQAQTEAIKAITDAQVQTIQAVTAALSRADSGACGVGK